MPVVHLRPEEPVVRAHYAPGLVLVRPDLYVAWRGDHSEDPLAVIDRVRGAVDVPRVEGG
jgi:hypothetical protein